MKIENNETFIGVIVSSFAKKGTTKIFIITNAGNPKLKATSAALVCFTSEKSNSPLKNKKLTISINCEKN